MTRLGYASDEVRRTDQPPVKLNMFRALQSYIDSLKAETEAANRQRQADQILQSQRPPGVKPLTLQIEELMRSLPLPCGTVLGQWTISLVVYKGATVIVRTPQAWDRRYALLGGSG
jgi:hypothetical protein